MRVPTRENRYFLSADAASPALRRTDDRVPSLGTIRAKADVEKMMVEAYAELRHADRLERQGEPGRFRAAFGPGALSNRMISLLVEGRWDRVLKKYGLESDQ